MSGIIGRKVGMTRVFDDKGKSVAVTVIAAGPCVVTQIKTTASDGYDSVQLGFEEIKERKSTKPMLKHFEKAGVTPRRILREFKGVDAGDLKLGDSVTAESFAAGDEVTVTGWSKGKGFQGVVKRHGFSGGPKSHGQSDRLRAPGSLGQSSYPSRVFKGLRMAGRTGNDRVTLRGRKVVRVLGEKNIIMVAGSVPGSANGLVLIRK
jgi:large subunit ribosomal protein L3